MVKKRLNVNLDKETIKALQHIAIEEETSTTEIVNKLVIAYIENYKKNK